MNDNDFNEAMSGQQKKYFIKDVFELVIIVLGIIAFYCLFLES